MDTLLPTTTRYEAFCAARRAMIAAWCAWLDERPNPLDRDAEMDATLSAVRQLVALR